MRTFAFLCAALGILIASPRERLMADVITFDISTPQPLIPVCYWEYEYVCSGYDVPDTFHGAVNGFYEVDSTTGQPLNYSITVDDYFTQFPYTEGVTPGYTFTPSNSQAFLADPWGALVLCGLGTCSQNDLNSWLYNPVPETLILGGWEGCNYISAPNWGGQCKLGSITEAESAAAAPEPNSFLLIGTGTLAVLIGLRPWSRGKAARQAAP